MREQRERVALRVPAPHFSRELGEVGHVPPPIVDVHHLVVAHITLRIAVPAVLEDAHGESGEQEIPCHFGVFRGEFGEPVRDDDGAVVARGRAGHVQLLEFAHVVAHVVQVPEFGERRQRMAQMVLGGRLHRAAVPAARYRRQHGLLHGGAEVPFVNHRDFHTDHSRQCAACARTAARAPSGRALGRGSRAAARAGCAPRPGRSSCA